MTKAVDISEVTLSPRVKECLILALKGISNNEIAEIMNITSKTVRFHLNVAYKKLKVKTRAQLIVNYSYLLKVL